MTMQISDNLIWHDLIHSVIEGPSIQKAFPELIIPKFDFISSACWRGYVSTWLIDDEGWLKLSQIICNLNEGAIDSADRFYEIFACDKPIAALGFNAHVMAGFGENVQPHGLYAVSYPNYRVFNFKDGRLTSFEEHDRAWWTKCHKAYELPDFLRNGKG